MENNKNIESFKEKFDKSYPEAKMLREYELKRTARNLFYKSTFGKASSVIYLIIALCSSFVYCKYFNINIFLSIIFGIITWFVIVYILDKILIKFSGVEQILTKMNDEGIESSGKKLEVALKEKGASIDDLFKKKGHNT
jgi:hypothetical protein